LAQELAIKQAIRKTKAKRIISFHTNVRTAKRFGTDPAEGIGKRLPDFKVFHVNGKQPATLREATIKDFRHAEKGFITNARCLTEGIDVPSVDMVVFVDPRHSTTDIVQATGRAMRKSADLRKRVGRQLSISHRVGDIAVT
jgi:predicted helicase